MKQGVNKLLKMNKNIFYFTVFGFLILLSCGDKNSRLNSSEDNNNFNLVDLMIGTDWNGHTFPGATLPNALVQLSPDTKTETWNNCSGYHYSDESILGFSHTHYSGTGAAGGGDILFMPTVGDIKMNPGDAENTESGYRSKFSHEKESAHPGYYAVLLEDYNIQVALTATKRVGFHKYDFPNDKQANVILDLVHGISDSPDSLYLNIDKNEISGYRAASGGLDKSNVIFFVAKFSEDFESFGLADNGTVRQNVGSLKGKNVKAFFTFPANEKDPLLLKVAISTVSIEGARKNMEAEIPHWDFDKVRKSAQVAWSKKLNTIQVEGGTIAQQKIFYTSLYHSFIHPNLYMDVDGKYRSSNKEIYTATKGFENYTTFSLWDTFRALHPLLTIIDQEKTNQYVRTFIERYEHTSNMPVMEFSGSETNTMIGSHAVSVVADAYIKGIRDYDVEKAYTGIKQLVNTYGPGKDYYLQYGFVPDDFSIESVSRTLEYSYDDWCISRLAKDFNAKDFNLYNQRGQFYKNVFSKESGFMSPKNSDYEWVADFDPKLVTKLHYTEANAYQYTPFAPQDIEGLIKIFGGDEKFETFLDAIFTTESDSDAMEAMDLDVTGLIGHYVHGNEPSHHIAYLYNYVGAGWKGQKRIREILTTLYFDTPDGISGNDDAGQMSAWYVFSAMGFYPVTPGLDYYAIGSPLFDKVTINLENGKKFEIHANNNGEDNAFVQSAELNGKAYTKAYLNHQDIMNGGKIVFEMGSESNKAWGAKKEDRPCSLQYECAPVPIVKTTGRKFLESTTASLSSKDKNAIIRYTLDGSEPDENSDTYKNPILISKTCTLRAKCFIDGVLPGYTVAFNFEKAKLQPASNVSGLKPGLKYEYKEAGFAKTSEMKNSPVSNSGIILTINIDSITDDRAFGYHYEGYIKVPADELYTFYLESNDGSTLFIDNEMIIDNDDDHMQQTLNAEIALKKGYHPIKVNYFQMGGGKKLEVSWKNTVSEIEVIPGGALYH